MQAGSLPMGRKRGTLGRPTHSCCPRPPPAPKGRRVGSTQLDRSGRLPCKPTPPVRPWPRGDGAWSPCPNDGRGHSSTTHHGDVPVLHQPPRRLVHRGAHVPRHAHRHNRRELRVLRNPLKGLRERVAHQVGWDGCAVGGRMAGDGCLAGSPAAAACRHAPALPGSQRPSLSTSHTPLQAAHSQRAAPGAPAPHLQDGRHLGVAIAIHGPHRPQRHVLGHAIRQPAHRGRGVGAVACSKEGKGRGRALA